MANVRNILFCLMLCAMMLSCAGGDDVTNAETQEQLNLVLSIGNTGNTTRQGLDVIQDDGQFRGLQNLLVIPFKTNGQAVTVNDAPDIPTVTGGEAERVTSKNYYYWNNCMMMRGTDRVLVWGHSATISGKEAPVQNGKLETTLEGRMLPKDITFSLQSIRTTYDIDQKAQDLADYMTDIAKTTGWSTTNDASLKGLYLDFIHAKSEGNGLMAGSAAHVKAYVAALRDQIKDNTDALSLAIIANIDAEAKSCLNNGYPSASTSLGLPDGAAALRWTNGAFAVRTQATTLDNINGITRYTYPAELWYYVDSPIRTSNKEVAISNYQASEWSTLLSTYYQEGNAIGSNTQSVAVEEPLQYGVGRLQITLNPTTDVLSDAKGNPVTNARTATMPLKSVIIGAQHTVGFDFKPTGDEPSDVDARFIYDPVVGSAATDGSYTVNTLVLQTYDGEKVPIVLEFENKTEQKFAGKDGIIYPDTKFYLIAQIDPADGNVGNASAEGRVFTQDYTTAMTMKVTSLANAYSCMPDLLAPRLEIGVEVVTQWIQPTTTTVVL